MFSTGWWTPDGRGKHMPIVHNGSIDPTETIGANIGLFYCDRGRAPCLVDCRNGNMALIYQGHYSVQDHQVGKIYGILSTDGFKTWSTPKLLYQRTDFSVTTDEKWVNFGAAGVDSNGRLHVLFLHVEETGVDAVLTQKYGYTDDLTLGTALTVSDITETVNAAEYPWFVFGPSKIIELVGGSQAGYLACGIDVRAEVGVEPSYSGVVYSPDYGATWHLGPVDDNADNYSNETDICEIGVSGRVYVYARRNQQQGRRHAVITDLTAASMTLVPVTYDTNAAILGYNCSGSVASTLDGDLYMVTPQNTTTADPGTGEGLVRGRLGVFLSTDAKLPATTNPTFPTYRDLNHGWGGYSTLYPFGNYLICVGEHARNQPQDGSLGTETLEVYRFDRDYVANPSEPPVIIDYHFNDATSGSVSTQGCVIRDHGSHGVHIPGSANTATWGNGYVSFAGGSNAGLMVEKLQSGTGEVFGGAFQIGRKSFAFGIRFRTSDATVAARYLVDNRNGSGAGWSLSKLATHNLQFLFSDGTFQIARIFTDATYDLNDGHWHTLWVSYNKGTGCRAWVSNSKLFYGGEKTFVELAPAADTITGDVTSTLACKIGSRSDNTLGFTGDISHIRFIHGKHDDTPVDLSTVTKVSPTFYRAPGVVNPVLDSTLASALSDSVLQLAPFWKDPNIACDAWGAWDFGHVPPREGQGFRAIRCAISSKLFGNNSATRTLNVIDNAACGKMIRIVRLGDATTTHYLARHSDATGAAVVDADFDFIQETGAFGISMVWMPSDISASSVILSTKDSSGTADGTHNGIWLVSETDGDVQVFIVSTDGTVINATFAIGLEADKPMYLGIDGLGNGGKVNCYYGEYTGTLTAPTLTAAASAGNITNLSASDSACNPLAIGGFVALADGACTSGAKGAFKNLVIKPTAFGASVHQLMANLAVQDAETREDTISAGYGVALQRARRGRR